jgi:hypothetical protein
MPDHEELRRRAAAAKGQTAGPSPASANAVLSLQSKVGNAAVQQLARGPKAKEKKPKEKAKKVRDLGKPLTLMQKEWGYDALKGRANSLYSEKKFNEAVSFFEAAYDDNKAKHGGQGQPNDAFWVYMCYRELKLKDAMEWWLQVREGKIASENARGGGD